MSELKPCPFVKAHGTDWLGVHTDGYFFWIECWMHRVFGESESTCCVGPKFLTEDEAVEAWNHRSLEDSLKAHAVEVLAVLYNQNFECSDMEDARRQARALLGWDNDNNEKEK